MDKILGSCRRRWQFKINNDHGNLKSTKERAEIDFAGLYKARRRCLHHLHFENDQLAKQPMILQNAWTPPITAETLKELSLDQITSNIQLRHDLLFDRNLRFRPNFDGASGKAKQRKAERYWNRLDRAFRSQENYEEFLPVLLDQVVQSLALLHHNDNWPKHITMDAVRSMLNPDLIMRGLATNTLDLKSRVQLVVSILHHMCPVEHRPRIQLFVLYFSQQCFAKGFRQCFATLEAIQLPWFD
ncbi:hypothetical protein BJV82DRAFT_658908 [Fennellomyces sp. T-0311]|nr:hypothetical protein BJV82DRAFT_658908 [Fennellomyces sp. T-0311]